MEEQQQKSKHLLFCNKEKINNTNTQATKEFPKKLKTQYSSLTNKLQ
jgi:hypothetical protein